jgi:hypothetical protein
MNSGTRTPLSANDAIAANRAPMPGSGNINARPTFDMHTQAADPITPLAGILTIGSGISRSLAQQHINIW